MSFNYIVEHIFGGITNCDILNHFLNAYYTNIDKIAIVRYTNYDTILDSALYIRVIKV